MTLRRLFAEFIGTFFLALVVCMTTYSKVSADIQPIAIGLFLMGLIYANGFISGAVFNPAVTLALWLRGRLAPKEALAYSAVQIVAGVAAAALTMVLTSAKPIVQPIAAPPQYFALIPALLAEFIGTFALSLVILNVATSKTVEGNNFYGLAIGFTQAAMIYTFSGVSGGFFNPAIAAGLSAIQLINYQNIWIYLIAAPIGAALSAYSFKFLSAED